MSRTVLFVLYFAAPFAVAYALSGNIFAGFAAGLIQPALYAAASFHERLWQLIDQATVPTLVR